MLLKRCMFVSNKSKMFIAWFRKKNYAHSLTPIFERTTNLIFKCAQLDPQNLCPEPYSNFENPFFWKLKASNFEKEKSNLSTLTTCQCLRLNPKTTLAHNLIPSPAKHFWGNAICENKIQFETKRRNTNTCSHLYQNKNLSSLP